MDAKLIWLKWRVTEEGQVEIVETRDTDEGYRRRRNDAGSVDEAAARYGEAFREVVEKVLESGSRKGRFRP